MNITALYYDYHDKSGEQNNHINKFVAAGLLYIIGHYFSSWSSYFVLTLCCRNNHTCNFYNDMFHKMFAEWEEWPLQIVVVKRNEYKKVPGLRQYNMILTDSYRAFLETEIHTYTAEYNSNEYYFIFLQTRDHLLFGEMQKIFEYCWRHYLINCIIQIQTAEGRILFYTYFPFTPKHCGKVEPVLVNEYNGTSLVNEDLFPKKLKNFYGCPIRAALWHIPPYVYLSTDSNNVTHITGGFEGKLLLEMAKKLNFSLNIVVPPNDSKRGMVKNGTLTGALKMLHEREADLSVGSFQQTYQRSLLLTPTITHYQTSWVVVTRREAYILTSFEFFLYPFTAGTWVLLIVMNILALGVAAFLRRIFYKSGLKNLGHSSMDIIAISLGLSAQYKPELHTGKILNATWMIYTLILRTTYQALLFHLIRTHVTRNMPQTLEELVAKNYSLIMEPATFQIFKKLVVFEPIKYIQLNTTLDTMALVYLEQLPLSEAKYKAATVPLIIYQYYTNTNYKADAFKVVPHSIMSAKLSIHLTKHSYLSEQIDELIIMIKSFGIVQIWYNQEVDINYVSQKHTAVNQLIDFQEFEMPLKLLLFGYIMALIALFVELFHRKLRSNRFVRKMFRLVNIFQRSRY
ncbi:uncharacterized protein ACRADG_006352 [Cochliomyia hominivorax]